MSFVAVIYHNFEISIIILNVLSPKTHTIIGCITHYISLNKDMKSQYNI